MVLKAWSLARLLVGSCRAQDCRMKTHAVRLRRAMKQSSAVLQPALVEAQCASDIPVELYSVGLMSNIVQQF